MNIKKTLLSTLIGTAALIATNTQAATLTLTITNITSGLHFTPLFIAAHTNAEGQRIFISGQPASQFPGLRELAESGANGDLETRFAAISGSTFVNNPVMPTSLSATATPGTVTNNGSLTGGPLQPGASVTTTFVNQPGQDFLSIAAMILPSNDGFVGIDSYPIPTTPGTYTFRINAWDAGTEPNAETRVTMPTPPFLTSGVYALGTGGTGVTGTATADPNTNVHIHRGNIGDFSPNGGISDMNASVHRWLNPVANVRLIVTP